MIPAPLVAFIRYAVVWECARLTAKGWTFFSFDPDTMDLVVNGVALGVALFGAYTATLAKRLAHLIAKHPVALVAAAAEIQSDPGAATAAALAAAKAVE